MPIAGDRELTIDRRRRRSTVAAVRRRDRLKRSRLRAIGGCVASTGPYAVPLFGGDQRPSCRRGRHSSPSRTGAVTDTCGRFMMSAAVSDSMNPQARPCRTAARRRARGRSRSRSAAAGGPGRCSRRRRDEREVQRLGARRAVADVAVVGAQRDRRPGVFSVFGAGRPSRCLRCDQQVAERVVAVRHADRAVVRADGGVDR